MKTLYTLQTVYHTERGDEAQHTSTELFDTKEALINDWFKDELAAVDYENAHHGLSSEDYNEQRTHLFEQKKTLETDGLFDDCDQFTRIVEFKWFDNPAEREEHYAKLKADRDAFNAKQAQEASIREMAAPAG